MHNGQCPKPQGASPGFRSEQFSVSAALGEVTLQKTQRETYEKLKHIGTALLQRFRRVCI